MSLLSQINDEILTTTEADVVGALLRRVKRRAYNVQTSQGVKVEVALRIALEEEYDSLQKGPPNELHAERERRKKGFIHIRNRYLRKRSYLTEDQIRSILRSYEHLSDQQKVKTILHRFKGRVRPADVQRIVKER